LQSEIRLVTACTARGILSKVCILSKQRSNIFHIIVTNKAAICPHSIERLAFLMNLCGGTRVL